MRENDEMWNWKKEEYRFGSEELYRIYEFYFFYREFGYFGEDRVFLNFKY